MDIIKAQRKFIEAQQEFTSALMKSSNDTSLIIEDNSEVTSNTPAVDSLHISRIVKNDTDTYCKAGGENNIGKNVKKLRNGTHISFWLMWNFLAIILKIFKKIFCGFRVYH